MGWPASDPKVVYQADSPFGPVFVVDAGDERTLRFDRPDGHCQCTSLKSQPHAVPMPSIRVAAAGLALTAGRSHALVIGLGGGTLPTLLRRCLPRMEVDVVEVNPVVVDVARRFFGLRLSARLRVRVEDGARFIRRMGTLYDFILLDGFSGVGIPEQLKKAAFFEDALRRLAPGGVVVVNIALETEEAKERVFATFSRAFPHTARLLGPLESANILGVGAQVPLPVEPQFRRELWRLERELRIQGLGESVTSYLPVLPADAAERDDT
ncbi:MAG: fused MFS/spermidine synthase, partial [Myxococcaceae bacterium]|nr:fused MFS/spermidine synthase [Myxococcaceae bacterium]